MLSGFANEDSVLYGEELRALAAADPEHMKLDIALSLQQKNKKGGQLYVQVGSGVKGLGFRAQVGAGREVHEDFMRCSSSWILGFRV
jgi:hypothetical protein